MRHLLSQIRQRGNTLRKNKRGATLVLVLITLVVLSYAVLDFQGKTTLNLIMSYNARDEVKAFYLAKGALEIAKLILANQTKVEQFAKAFGYKGKLQLWKLLPLLVDNMFCSGRIPTLESMGRLKGLGMDTGSCGINIYDENSKININRAKTFQEKKLLWTLLEGLFRANQYDYFFQARDAYGQNRDRLTIISAIVDWTDEDNQIFTLEGGTAGSEDGYYSALKDPYEVKNAKFDSLAELYLVRGVDDEFMRLFGPSLTIYSGDKINVAEASRQTIKALLCSFVKEKNNPICMDQKEDDKLDKIVDCVLLAKEDSQGLMAMVGFEFEPGFKDATAFFNSLRNCPDYKGFEMDENALRQVISTDSTAFLIEAWGETGKVKKQITTVIDITSGRLNMLYYREFSFRAAKKANTQVSDEARSKYYQQDGSRSGSTTSKTR